MKPLARLLLVACYMLLPAASFGATAYTTRAAFDAATAGFPNMAVVNFDAQLPGAPAVNYADMTISAAGLGSDGLTHLTLSPIATNSFPAMSGGIVLGIAGLDSSFMAGNDDSITFTFASPVHAFGCYMIGNPSPTGTPALPFWRMHVNTPSGFDGYSATDPMFALGVGNHVYFLGITSVTAPFTQVALFSNNDLAAVYSFNVDDVVTANAPPTATIAQAKSMASGSVTVSDGIVTRVHSDRFNIETADRTAAIMVRGSGATRGSAITVAGSIGKNSDDECLIEMAQIAD